MAYSSFSHRRTQEHDAFSGIEPHGTRRKVDESSSLFDVFISHRGPDVKQTVALQLYNSLKELRIRAFLDSEEKELGDSFPSTIENAIHSALAHIAIFSNGYAGSPWCLAELVLMLQSNAKIIPIFYGVKPSALRYIETGVYGEAFTEYENKKRYMEKHRKWKEALQSVSLITGYEISSNFNISDCQNIVSAVQKEVQRKKSLRVAKYPVGLPRLVRDFEKQCLDQLVEDFERQCLMDEGRKEKAQIVGIFGMGGVGKTTLAKELFNRKNSQYRQGCFLYDVREAYANNSFPSLQMELLKDLFRKDELNFRSKEAGKTHIADCIERSKALSFLIVLDDIDDVEQLDALLIMEMLKNSVDSLVIVTTRDVGVLINSGITSAYNLKEMDRHHARELFCWHAFGQPHPAKDYINLVNSFLDVCRGLPLSLQVIGSHVQGTDQNYWSLELNKVSKTLPRGIHQRLKISFDALDYEQQQIFLDIACFFVDKSKHIALRIWEASERSAQHALQTLKNKCLVQEIETYSGEGVLRMHDHLRDLGREIANGPSRPCRVWRRRDLKHMESKGFQYILSQIKGRCFHSFIDNSMNCRITYFLAESDVIVDTSTVLLWLELKGLHFQNQGGPCIPSWIPLQNLQCLILDSLLDKHVQGPRQLKELEISNCLNLQELDLRPSNCLEKIVLYSCSNLKTVWGISDLRKLVELDISECPMFEQLRLVGLNSLKRIKVDHSFKPACFELDNCKKLEKISGSLNIEKLVSINIRDCPMLGWSPSLEGPSKLETVTIDGCAKLNDLRISTCQNLKTVTGEFDLATFVIEHCPELETLPFLEGVTCLETITVDGCGKLSGLQLLRCQTCLEKISIVRCGKLETLTIDGCVKLSNLRISSCQNLKTVTGKFDLATFVIEDCSELETITVDGCGKLSGLQLLKCQTCLEKISIVRCGKLETVTIDGCVKLSNLRISSCQNLKRVTGKFHLATFVIRNCSELETLPFLEGVTCLETITVDGCGKLSGLQLLKCQNLKQLRISDCPELEELACCASQTCLENICIFRCGKLQNISFPTRLEELRIEECRELKTVAAICDDSECREQQEFSGVDRLHCLKRITIQACDKLQTIQGFDELHVLKWLQLLCCSNPTIRRCISMFKSVRPKRLLVVGKAVDGALSILNPHLFPDTDTLISDIRTPRSGNWQRIMGESNVVIYCLVVVVNSYLENRQNGRVQQREWIIIGVTTDQYYGASFNKFLENFPDPMSHQIMWNGIMKKGYKVVVVKKDALHVLHTIIDKLYKK